MRRGEMILLRTSLLRFATVAVLLGWMAGARAAELPAEADLRPVMKAWDLGPRSQGKRPTCSVFTFTGGLEFALGKARKKGERLSVDYVNWAANQEREKAKGTMALELSDNWIKKWNPKTGLSEGEFASIKETLNAGWPVCGGFRWPNHAAWKDGVLQVCGEEDVFDGHSVLLVGYRDDSAQPGGGVFLIRDSGSGEDRAMPYGYAKSFMNDALWIGCGK